MKTFHCHYCAQPLFFENFSCLKCGSKLAFLPDRMNLAPIEEAPDEPGLWRPRLRREGAISAARYRLCRNNEEFQACNFAVRADDPNPFCVACRLTRVLPDLSKPENPTRWARIEAAKRRLFYTLARLGLLSTKPPAGEIDGPVFEFLEDQPGQPVMTGHNQGLITINVAEADDAERIARREALHEPYRTLLGHFRHESGHYYWDRLIDEGGRQDSCRAIFGDDRKDYSQSLQEHYARGGTLPDWQKSYVTAYATAHPWEDWAETWAHYLHMVDLLETAASYNTRLSLPGDGGELEEVVNPLEELPEFDVLVEQWVPLTLLCNSLNRSLGQEDAYPFALSGPALEKLRYIHDVIRETREKAKPQVRAQNRSQDGAAPSPATAEGPAMDPAEKGKAGSQA